jgi:hypothetical protein
MLPRPAASSKATRAKVLRKRDSARTATTLTSQRCPQRRRATSSSSARQRIQPTDFMKAPSFAGTVPPREALNLNAMPSAHQALSQALPCAEGSAKTFNSPWQPNESWPANFRRGGVAHAAPVCGLTFELSGRRRQDARPGLAKMYRVPPDRAWRPAVGAPLERGVRHRCSQAKHWRSPPPRWAARGPHRRCKGPLRQRPRLAACRGCEPSTR